MFDTRRILDTLIANSISTSQWRAENRTQTWCEMTSFRRSFRSSWKDGEWNATWSAFVRRSTISFAGCTIVHAAAILSHFIAPRSLDEQKLSPTIFVTTCWRISFGCFQLGPSIHPAFANWIGGKYFSGTRTRRSNSAAKCAFVIRRRRESAINLDKRHPTSSPTHPTIVVCRSP